MNQTTTKIQAYSKQQLCDLYNISRTTLKKWLQAASIDTGKEKILNPNQIRELFEKVGKPED